MLKNNHPMQVSITAGTFVKAILVLIMFYVIYILRDLALAILTSVVLASAVEPFTAWLVKRKIPRTIAVLGIYIFGLISAAVVLFLVLPVFLNDLKNVFNNLPSYLDTFILNSPALNETSTIGSVLGDLSVNLQSQELLANLGSFGNIAINFVSVAGSIFGGLLNMLIILVLSFYLAVQEDGVANFLRIISPVKKEEYILDLWKRTRRKIGLWMQGQIILALLIGILTYLFLSILGIENAFILALIAALFELIPVFGPILAAIPAIAIGLAQGGVTTGLFVLGAYIIIQQFESQLIHPLVVKKIVGIPALIAIVALIAGGTLAGFLGIILSVPLTAAIMEFISDVEKKKHILQDAIK